MDYLEKGKNLAKNSQYEEALEALSLAYENDKENPDIYFYMGLCFSALEEFQHAKYCYEMALTFNPNHEKTQIVWDGVKDFDSQKPPQDRLIRKASAHERQAKAPVEEPKQEPAASDNVPPEDNIPAKDGPKLTDEKWEQAFPTEYMEMEEKMPLSQKVIVFLLLIVIIGAIVYFILQIV